MIKKLSLSDLDLAGKKVLMRVDYNVPFDKLGNITDDTRIKASLPSIHYALVHGASLILMSHLGRPKGSPSKEFSLAPCAKRLSELLGIEVIMAPDCVGSQVEALASSLKPGQIMLLENLRFHKAEEKPQEDPSFAKQLASLGDIYVNDAFGTAHRAHSSTVEITKYFPEKAAAGFLMEKEISILNQLLSHPAKPFFALIGGAKISSKIGVLKVLLKKVDKLLIGGGMAYTFLKAQGIAIGKSIHEDKFLDNAKEILEYSKAVKVPLLLPEDILIANEISEQAAIKVIETNQGIPQGYHGVDIGPKTASKYAAIIKEAGTVFWNGPMGIFEIKQFAKGTDAIAKALATSSAMTIVGGGESVAAVEQTGIANKITHISTGGGATIEFIEHGTLPGIEALSDKI